MQLWTLLSWKHICYAVCQLISNGFMLLCTWPKGSFEAIHCRQVWHLSKEKEVTAMAAV